MASGWIGVGHGSKKEAWATSVEPGVDKNEFTLPSSDHTGICARYDARTDKSWRLSLNKSGNRKLSVHNCK